MSNNFFKPEVLSPVGSYDMLIAAVRSGADAVYLGAKEFNARRNADNFDGLSLKDAVEYCHIRGVKVYLTLNILISDSEMSNAVNLAREAYNFGIDAVIVADIGLAANLHRYLPLLPLHASTQMTVYDSGALPPLKAMGFSRVVAAREMNREELCELCSEAKKLDMEVEVFVHGALCMCLSGQCLLSAVLGGRSGNRGLCAGPCRLPFSDNCGNQYALSLKDLSLLDHIQELQKMGVASLKIEGRMKRPEYVAAATCAFRNMVDTGEVPQDIRRCLLGVFSRSGFTDGYFENKLGKDMFGIRTKEEVISATDSFPFLHEITRHERKSVKISLRADILTGQKATVTLSDGENSVTVFGDVPEAAINKPLTARQAEERLLKLGSTPYYAETATVNIDNGLTLRSSALNELRRQATEKLDIARSRVTRQPIEDIKIPDFEKAAAKSTKIWLRTEDISLIPSDISDIYGIILPIEKDHNLSPISNIPAIAELPKAGLYGKWLLERLKLAKSQGFQGAMVQNIAQIDAVKQAGLTVYGGIGMNVFSSHSLLQLQNMGFSCATLSPELTKEQINSINSPIPTAIFGYGRLPLMVTKNCPVGLNGCGGCDKKRTLTDRKGISFNVKCQYSFSTLYADRPIVLSDRQCEFNTDYILLYFTLESKGEIEQVLNNYKSRNKAKGTFTRGLYYRGVE